MRRPVNRSATFALHGRSPLLAAAGPKINSPSVPSLKGTGALVMAALILTTPIAYRHGGGLDADGCHYDRKDGNYHCHRGPLGRLPALERAKLRRLLADMPAHAAEKQVELLDAFEEMRSIVQHHAFRTSRHCCIGHLAARGHAGLQVAFEHLCGPDHRNVRRLA